MTAVAFHFNVPDRRDYLCRLLRKATRQGARVMVAGQAHQLDELDRLLWVFEPLEFVPHWRGRALAALPARLAATPVVLLDEIAAGGGYDVLLNVGASVPPGCEHFERLIEVVGRDESERAAARDRWRHYGSLGWPIERHEVRA